MHVFLDLKGNFATISFQYAIESYFRNKSIEHLIETMTLLVNKNMIIITNVHVVEYNIR